MIAAQPRPPLHPQRVRSLFPAGDRPNQVAPHRQRLRGPLKDRSGPDRTLQPAVRIPMAFASHLPRLPITASGTFKTARPPRFNEGFPAGGLGRKTFWKRQQRSWIVFSHAATRHLGVTGVNCIAQKWDIEPWLLNCFKSTTLI